MDSNVGTCAICDRAFKTQNGCVSLHGFRRPGSGGMRSSISGRCFGSYRVAIEINTSACEEYKAHLSERAIPEAEAWVQRVANGESTQLVNFSGRIVRPGESGWERAVERELGTAKTHLGRLRRELARMDAKIADKAA